MRFPEMTPTRARTADRQRNDILFGQLPDGLGLHFFKAGEVKVRILTELSKTGPTNAYELWKRLGEIRNYSTIFRALRVLEFTNLVKVVSSKETARKARIYSITRLGVLILALGKDGWRTVAQLLAEDSPSFRECIALHFSDEPYFYWHLARDIIQEYVKASWHNLIDVVDIDSLIDVEKIVRRIELDWIKENIINEFNNPSLPLISNYIKKVSNISWITSELLPYINDCIEEEKEKLQILNGYKSGILSAEKLVRLTKFVSNS